MCSIVMNRRLTPVLRAFLLHIGEILVEHNPILARQRPDGGGGKAWAAAHHPHGIPEIGSECPHTYLLRRRTPTGSQKFRLAGIVMHQAERELGTDQHTPSDVR